MTGKSMKRKIQVKYREIVEYGKNELKIANVADYDSDAFLMLEHLTGLSKAEYFIKAECQLENNYEEAYKALIKERCSGRPLQYITGHQEFMGLDFKVNEAVLIPRFDTEVLVEAALDKIKACKTKSDELKVLDMCTGSGCIGISIARLAGIKNITCADISEEALQVAAYNAEHNQVSYINFVNSNLFENISGDNKFDFILSNPPYIRTEDIEGLMREVKMHEPKLALDGDRDGLKFYRSITSKAPLYLRNGGWLIYEIGCDQGKDVSDIMREEGFSNVEIIKDLAGHDRVVIGSLNIGGNDNV